MDAGTDAYAAYRFAQNWQTLIAGALAFAGAAWTVQWIRNQVRQAEEVERERRRRDERAARAVLPLALSSLVQYCLECIQLIEQYIPGAGPARPVNDGNLIVPRFPNEAIEPVQAVVRHSDDATAQQIATLLSKLQIQHARLVGLISRSLKDARARMSLPEAQDAIYDAADLYAFIVRMFGYAQETEAARERPQTGEIKAALRAAGIWDGDNPRLYAFVERRTGSD